MAISPQRLTIYLYSAHRAVIFAIAQLSCSTYWCYSSHIIISSKTKVWKNWPTRSSQECPSVCLPHIGIASKQLTVSSFYRNWRVFRNSVEVMSMRALNTRCGSLKRYFRQISRIAETVLKEFICFPKNYVVYVDLEWPWKYGENQLSGGERLSTIF